MSVHQNKIKRAVGLIALFCIIINFFAHTFFSMVYRGCVSKKIKRFMFFSALFSIIFIALIGSFTPKIVSAMPFYDLQPKDLVLRASFYTTYASSSQERKSNIRLSAKAINNAFIDVGGEFSFNKVVGARTEKRGYKKAKIIVGGEFVDGIGGGVCQVSTTLYNAVLLAGLEILECHPHSLPVSYVAPSFDAMVNSGCADLKFKNNTKNPVYIKTCADDQMIKISIYGEPMNYKVKRVSKVIEKVSPPPEQVFIDEKGEYPSLYKGEKMIVRYAKEGYKSQGYLEIIKNGYTKTEKIRTDKYNGIGAIVVYGNADFPIELEKEEEMLDLTIVN